MEIWFCERGPDLKRSPIVFTPSIHGRTKSPGIFYPRHSIDPTFNEKQPSTRVPSSLYTRHDFVYISRSLSRSFRQQHSASSSSIFPEPVPDTGTGSILLVSITAATSLHPHVELEEDFLVTIQQHFYNPQSTSAPAIFRYTRPITFHPTYQFNIGSTKQTTLQGFRRYRAR